MNAPATKPQRKPNGRPTVVDKALRLLGRPGCKTCAAMRERLAKLLRGKERP